MGDHDAVEQLFTMAWRAHLSTDPFALDDLDVLAVRQGALNIPRFDSLQTGSDDPALAILDPLADVPREVKAAAWDFFHLTIETDPNAATLLERQLSTFCRCPRKRRLAC